MKSSLIHRNDSRQKVTQVPNPPNIYDLPRFALDFITFQTQCAPASTPALYFKQLFRFTVILHTAVGYFLMAADSLSASLSQLLTLYKTQPSALESSRAAVYCLNLLLMALILTNKQKITNEIILSIVKLIVSNYILLEVLNLTLTFLLAYVNFWTLLPAMLIVGSFALFQSFFCDNYCAKSQLDYQSSPISNVMFTAGIILHFVANCAIFSFGTLQTFLGCSLFFGVCGLIWYLAYGYKQFFHKTPRNLQIAFWSLLTALNVQFALMLFINKPTLDFLELAISFLVISFFLVQFSKQKTFLIQYPSQQNDLKSYQLGLHFLLQDSNEDPEIEQLIVGLLSSHYSHGCTNVRCKIQHSSPKIESGSLSLVKDKHQLLIYHLKCHYEATLCTQRSIQNMIDYCEFMVSEFGNFSTHCFYLNELTLNQKDLGLFQKIKIVKLRLILKEQSEAFNKLLFGSKVQFFQVLQSDQHFAFITQTISDYCKQSVHIWKLALQKTINVTQWKDEIQRNFQLLPLIDQRWKVLSKYFEANKYWKFLYLNYAYYLKNQDVKNRHFEREGLDQSKLIQYTLDNKLKSVKDNLFFDEKAATVEAKWQQGRLLFKKVNKNFEKLTHYTENEVVNMPLSLIQPREIIENHDKRVFNMIENGNTLKEDAYHVVSTHFFNKFGEKIGAALLFKFYISPISTDCIIHFLCVIAAVPREFKVSPLDSSSDRLAQRREYRTPLELNIFVKEESLQPTQNYAQLNKIVRGTRFVIFLVFVSIVIMLLVFNNQLSMTQTQISQQSFMLAAYRYPMAITINYIKQFLNLTDPALVNAKIKNSTANFMQVAIDPKMISILSDQTVNLPARYAPYLVLPANQGIAYDQIDLSYVLYSSIVTLSNGSKINRTGTEYLKLDSYLMQYNRMTNGTKMQLHAQFSQLMLQMCRYQLVGIGVGALVFLVFTAYVCYRVYHYYGKRTELITIILQFGNPQITANLQYWRDIASSFAALTSTLPHLSSLKNDSLGFNSMREQLLQQDDLFLQRQKQPKISLNQRSKIFVFSPHEHSQLRKVILCLVGMTTLLACVNLAVPVFNLVQLTNLTAFQSAGFDIFRYVSFTGELSYGLARAYYWNLYPNETALTPQLFNSTLASLQIMAQYQYSEVGVSESVFVNARKNYLFGNPCTYNPSVLYSNNATMQNCLTLANSSFTSGLCAYLRNIQPTIVAFLNGKLKQTLAQVNGLSSSMAIASYYFYDLAYSWLAELTQQIAAFEGQSLGMSVVGLGVSVVVYLLVMELWLISKLEQNYSLIKSIYGAYVPQSILVKEKVVRQKFCQTGVVA